MKPGPKPGTPCSQPLGGNSAALFWPTEERRPGESFSAWLRRLDDYANAELGSPSPWRGGDA